MKNNKDRLPEYREWLSRIADREPNSKFTQAYATRELLNNAIMLAEKEIKCLNDKILEGHLDYAGFAYANFLSGLKNKCDFFDATYKTRQTNDT